jgi:hypothetical protein
MIPIFDNWTVVIAGQWNPAMINAEWIGRTLLQRPPGTTNIRMEIILDQLNGNIQRRFFTSDLVIKPDLANLTFGVKRNEDQNLNLVSQVASRVLTELNYTPITGIGINFGFKEDNPPAALASIFDIEDRTQIADLGMQVRATDLRRAFDIGNNNSLNLTQEFQNGSVSFQFNFHHNINTIQAATALLNAGIVRFRDQALEFLRQCYDIELETPDTEVVEND